jgi:hypothetical protein
MAKIEELVARSGGRVRADVVHRRIAAMGFAGGERTTRRAVAEVKARFAAGRRRVFRPWIPEPGLWLQFDWGEGPRIGGRRTSLWCARSSIAKASTAGHIGRSRRIMRSAREAASSRSVERSDSLFETKRSHWRASSRST